eukprot:5426447-Amphidinium_carterae.1
MLIDIRYLVCCQHRFDNLPAALENIFLPGEARIEHIARAERSEFWLTVVENLATGGSANQGELRQLLRSLMPLMTLLSDR